MPAAGDIPEDLRTIWLWRGGSCWGGYDMPASEGATSDNRNLCLAPAYFSPGQWRLFAKYVTSKGSNPGLALCSDWSSVLGPLRGQLRKKNIDQFKQLGLIVGKPLPNKGACRHYAHSYRWLRFPCCGRAHPCAVCHELSDCPAVRHNADRTARGPWRHYCSYSSDGPRFFSLQRALMVPGS